MPAEMIDLESQKISSIPSQKVNDENMENILDYSVADINLASQGIKDIENADSDNYMFPIRILRNRMDENFLSGTIICGCTKITPSIGVMVKTLKYFGATLRWCCPRFSPVDDSVAAAMASMGIAVYAWDNCDSEGDFNWCLDKCLDGVKSSAILIDDGGDLSSHLITKYPEKAQHLLGVVEESLCGIRRLGQFFRSNNLSFPVINTSEAIVKKFCSTLFISKESVVECLQQFNIMICGTKFLVCGYGHRGKMCCNTLKQHGGDVSVTEIDPVSGYEAIMDGNKLVNIEEAIQDVDVIITCTGGSEVVKRELLEKAKTGCFVMNLGKSNVEIDVKSLQVPEITWDTSDETPISKLVWQKTGKHITLLAEGRMASQEFSTCPMRLQAITACTLILGAKELKCSKPGRYQPGIFMFPRILDEQLAELCIEASHGHVTRLTADQAKFFGISPNGPFKTVFVQYTSPSYTVTD